MGAIDENRQLHLDGLAVGARAGQDHTRTGCMGRRARHLQRQHAGVDGADIVDSRGTPLIQSGAQQRGIHHIGVCQPPGPAPGGAGVQAQKHVLPGEWDLALLDDGLAGQQRQQAGTASRRVPLGRTSRQSNAGEQPPTSPTQANTTLAFSTRRVIAVTIVIATTTARGLHHCRQPRQVLRPPDRGSFPPGSRDGATSCNNSS